MTPGRPGPLAYRPIREGVPALPDYTAEPKARAVFRRIRSLPLGATVVTNKVKEFERVPRLQVRDWTFGTP
jgi:hypothetical protein